MDRAGAGRRIHRGELSFPFAGAWQFTTPSPSHATFARSLVFSLMSKRRVVIGLWILLGLAAAGFGLYFFATNKPSIAAGAEVTIHVPALIEASGLAPSRHSPDVLWSHNDSGGQPVLYAFDTQGQERGRVRVQGAKNNDWEAIASFELDGKAWIAIGDIGDNTRSRRNCAILVVEEPRPELLAAGQETPVPIAWSIPYRFETGPHDCEALLVEPRLRLFYIITKRTYPPALYTLPLQPVFSGKPTPLIAKKIGSVAHMPVPNMLQRLFPTARGRYRGEPTDACFSPDGLNAAVLTYADVLVYHRNPGQPWELAFQHQPEHLAQHAVNQAEGLAFSIDGKSLFITGEQHDPPLVRYALP